MVRETRHLWVGNLPDNIREDRIKDHFKRYGRVQNVKLLGRTESASTGPSVVASSGVCATVAFMDIKSASKAHNAEHVLDERTLTTEYYEPAAIPSAAGAPSAGSSPAGSGYSGSSSSVNSAPTPASVARYHLSGGEESATATCAIAATAAAPANWRGTNDSATEYCRRGSTPAAYGRYQRNNSTAPYATPPSNVERTPHHRWYASGERGATGGESTPSTPGGGTESGRRRRSGSGSSRSESSSPEPSDASRASSAGAPGPPAPPHHAAAAAARTPPTQHHHQWSSTASGRPLAICVRNLPTRSTDSSLKDGLYHEYKKHGKVVWVKVVGQNADRYAVVRFKKPSDVEKALEVSQDKLFFGCKISVAPHQSCDEDADSAKPYETDIDEYHPKATRTLFIGNLEKDVTQQQLRDKFKHFGRIIEIDIKKGSGGGAGYAFCQYASISSVVEAIRAMDGEYVGSSRVKLGFGKPVATTCVWVDGLTEHTEKQVLSAVARCGAATSVCVDRAAGAALVHFEQASAAGACVRELRRVAALACAGEPDRHRLAVDYASRECQEAFYEQLEKHGGSAALSASERLSGDLTPRYIPSTRHEQLSSRYEGAGPRSRASSYGRAASRTPRYSSLSLDHYDAADYASDRRYRVYDELGSSPQADETPYEDRLQSVVVSPHRSRRHRRDSSPEDRKHSKERHRSSGGATCSTRRSRSGSRGCAVAAAAVVVAAAVSVPVERHSVRRRHRRRRDGTPLRDEPLPCEPRRPPPPRPTLPMSLPLPKFAAQLLRAAPPAPRPPPPAPAPASPPRAPSASSSSAGSAPHSPSLEERIRSLDEKYEKWSGSRALPEAPDRARLRHRLLEVDINEVKPSEVVRSLLAKRSVFDEDSERLEGAVRAPSPGGSPRARLLLTAPSMPATPSTPRALRYPFPVHPLPLSATGTAPAPDSEPEADRPSDPRLNRPERTYMPERLGKINESDYRLDSRIRLRTPSTDKPAEMPEKRTSPKGDRDRVEKERDPKKQNVERRRLEFLYIEKESQVKASFEAEEKEVKEAIEKIDPDFQSKETSLTSETEFRVESNEKEETQGIKTENVSNENVCVSQPLVSVECIKTEIKFENEPSLAIESSVKCASSKSEILKYSQNTTIDDESKLSSFNLKTETEKVNKDVLVQNHINKEVEIDTHLSNLSIKSTKEVSDLGQEFIKGQDKNGKERYNQNIILEAFHTKLEKENIEFERASEKDKTSVEKKISEVDKNIEDRQKSDREKTRHNMKDKTEKDRHDEKAKSSKIEKLTEKCDKEKKSKDDTTIERSHHDKIERVKIEKELEKMHKEKNDRDIEKSKHSDEKLKHSEEKSKHSDEKSTRLDHHRKDKSDKDKRKESVETEILKTKKEEKYKSERRKDSTESKRESKKDTDSVKSRKSSRDETSRDLIRKDSTDSTASRTSHDSSKIKDIEHTDVKEEAKHKTKPHVDVLIKQEHEKDSSFRTGESNKPDGIVKIKLEKNEEKEVEHHLKDITLEPSLKCKHDISEKQRHYSLDSLSVDPKRKERLNSCSSLPSNIGHKRRISSQDSLDSLTEDVKKSKNECKGPERRDSKDLRNFEKHKTAKFNKGHFAKIIESKTKDDKKNQVKPPDDSFIYLKDIELKDHKKPLKKSPNSEEDKTNLQCDAQPERLQHDLDFLATLELRSSEEDEMQKALRKEMKEKKRIQQLQQIQQLQMQQDALNQAELMGKLKDEKKQKSDEKRKEAAREKRMSTDRKSRDEKSDSNKSRCNKGRKNLSTDSSDSDEPKKQHSIFDIIDDEPTYISMYDKVKARSCKNMQKLEEEKRQEKIKAKFCQLKQSRAKREEKKRSSWDEDSDSEQDRRKSNKTSIDSSSEDENILIQSKKREKSHGSSLDYERSKINDYFSMPSTEEDSRNKLSRKNSRTRIISDTSDDETSKRSKSPSYFGEMRKEFLTDFESLQRIKDGDVSFNDSPDKVKKNSLLNLFGKSDSDDSKLKSSLESNDSKCSYMKALCNDFSSESESMISNRNIEIRKKQKKKQKKHKILISDDEIKINDVTNMENEFKNKNPDKIRRHSNKKEKRKDKIRPSVDAEESREEKIKSKKEKKVLTSCFDSGVETNSNKKDGKMEDIFGPISDDSDRDVDLSNNKLENSIADYTPTLSTSNEQLTITTNSEESKFKDENKRKKEKRKKERRLFTKDDDNSLDVDAVGKAIEARLFADSMTDDESRVKMESLPDYVTKNQKHEHNYEDINLGFSTSKIGDRHDKLKRDNKEKKKKKKRSKEDRQNRKEHHYHLNNEKIDKHDYPCEKESSQLSPKTMLLNIPLPTDIQSNNKKTMLEEDRNCLTESPSLPRLTDSPPVMKTSTESADPNRDSSTGKSDEQKANFVENSMIEINDIPMPPPREDVIVQDISEVPLPDEPVPSNKISLEQKTETIISSFSRDMDKSVDAVRCISNLEKDTDTDKSSEKLVNESQLCKVDKKIDEKPRAIISQEETEDAVAALLGESFGGKVDSFANCFDETDNSSTHQDEIESTATATEIILEEDAEEMRQAVQNLNASEMEMKPDTPVSDNDLLLIDTDTEENDDAPQETIERLPSNTATNNSLNVTSVQTQPTEETCIVPKQNSMNLTVPLKFKELPIKISEAELKLQAIKRDSQQITSTATPVITSWTLTNNKLIEPHLLNIQSNQLSRDTSENKHTHVTANIVQIKSSQNQTITTSLRPIITPNRVSAPYQVINHIIRPQVPNMQPPTIKIPEPHILYQKSSGIVISPRMSNDPRLQSPKASLQGDGMSSPCLTNMAILSTSQQNFNSVGIASANTIQQRSPGQVTVVRMQQPPLSPIQAMHLPHGARTMVSPNRPNSVLVQTQGSPLHFNRVTPVLATLSKQLNKGIPVGNSSLTHQQKVIPGDARKNEHRTILEHPNDNSKIILSPTSLQHSTNPTVMAQNRLISIQNAVHAGNMNSAVHLTNKVVIGNMNHLSDKREIQINKSEQSNHISFGTAPIIHVAGVNNSTASIIHTGSKSVMCSVQEQSSISRSQGSNVIHTLNSQRLLTTAPISNVIQIETSKCTPSVLSMANIRPPSVVTKLESSNTVAVTTNSMTPLSLKTSNPSSTIRLSPKEDSTQRDVHETKINSLLSCNKSDDVAERQDPPKCLRDVSEKQKDNQFKPIVTSETDFEELLKDNTNEIKISNDPEKKVEINVGKTLTTMTTNTTRNLVKNSIENLEKQVKKEKAGLENISSNSTIIDTKDDGVSKIDDKVRNSIFENTGIIRIEKQDVTLEKALFTDKGCKDGVLNINSNEVKTSMDVKPFSQDHIFPNPLAEQYDNNSGTQTKNDENEPWSSKDLNIESVIKKVEYLCNDSTDSDKRGKNPEIEPTNTTNLGLLNSTVDDSPILMETSTDTSTVPNSTEDTLKEKSTTTKRGGRNVRGKKSDRTQDRVQTRQISKTPRGAASAKRGRGGRAKVDKKIKSLVNNSLNNIPGDVYDFHEDSGDESSTSANKSETRPRLILTIKSPLSGQTNAIATSTLSITPKDQPKNNDKVIKDDKPEDFVSPLNTRKSRRLLEKDVQRSTVDDVIEDVVKGGAPQNKGAKDTTNKKRQTRQVGAKASQQDKGSGSDTRKSPRGVKRTRDRSLSDASVDSSDEKVTKKEHSPKDSKLLKLAEPLMQAKEKSDLPQAAISPPASISSAVITVSPTTQLPVPAPAAVVAPAPIAVLASAATAVVASTPIAVVASTPIAVVAPAPVAVPAPVQAPTPIMKPPKKMISEISAKLASAFEAATSTPMHPQVQAERVPMEVDKPALPLLREPRNPELASAAPATEAIVAATGDARASAMGVGSAGEAAGTSGERARRRDALAGGAEASDARVQSPALPHRLPDRADRVTPLLIRGEAREGDAVAVARRYAGTASLPRGAHLPPPSHLAPHAHHPHAKQVAVVGPHHHHPGAASRVTITSVPTISPQGQIAMGEGMYPHFSQQHYQMYQQHFRATQHEARATPSPYTRTLEAEGCEAPAPPLELRRPPSARVPRPAHSPAPNDRLILYAAGCGRSPPPAHGTSRLPGALPPAPPGPPHASQVPREADSLQMLLRRYPVMWQGLLALKNDSAAVQMHFVGGNPGVAEDTLPRHTDGSTPPLRIAQRMRLEPTQLDQVHRKMKLENEHCILLALPCGRDHMDVLQQSTNLTGGFITYLQRKQAAGIVNVAPPGHHQAMYTVHIFPTCEFANENLSRIAPDLMHRVADIAHLLIVIATATA